MKKLLFFLFPIIFILNTAFSQEFVEDYTNSYFENVGDSVNNLINLAIKTRKDDYNKTTDYYNKAIILIKNTTNNELQLATIYGHLGEICYEQGSYTKALEYHINSYDLYSKNKNKKGIADALNQIGTMYDILREPEKAIAALEEALDIRLNIGDSINIADSYNNIGVFYFYQKKYNTALKYYQNALDIVPVSRVHLQTGVFNNIGEIYCKQKKYDIAEEYFQKSIIAYKIARDKYHIAMVLKNIGEVYIGHKQYETGINYLEQSLKIASEIGSKLQIKETMEVLRDKHKEVGEFEQALKYSMLLSGIKDSLFNQNHIEVVAEMNTKFETSRIEKENELLTKEAQIHELEYKQNQLILFSFGIFILSLIILSILQYRKNNYKTATNEILHLKNKELAELNATKNKFFSIISHDLKNPLSAFRNITQALCDNFTSMDNTKISSFLSHLNKSSIKLYELLHDLLTWSRMQSNKITNKPEVLSLKNIITSNVELLKPNAAEKNIELQINVDKNHNIYADKLMISSVIANLLTNAIKFTNKDGKIKIGTKLITNSATDEKIQVSISDTGIGMKKEDLKKLFRIDIDNTEIGNSKEKGSGLGLILAKEFINNSNGELWVESEYNKGSTFFFTVPKVTVNLSNQ